MRLKIFCLKELDEITDSGELMADGPDRRLGAIVHPELVKYMDYMTFNRMRADAEDIGDFQIGGPGGYQAKHLNLPVRPVTGGILVLGPVWGQFQRPRSRLGCRLLITG
jgi:hypothetical protein